MNAVASPSAVTSGTLERTPLPHLFVFLHEKRLSGTLEVSVDDESASIAVEDGNVTKVQTSRPVAYLGALLYEQGIIDAAELNSSLAQMASERKLHGQVLLERGVLSIPELKIALKEQSLRKLTHVLSFPKTALFSFHHDVDRLAAYAGDGERIDPLPAIWRAAREMPPWDQVNAVKERIGTHRIRLRKDAAVSRFDFFSDESLVVAELARRPLTLSEITVFNGFGGKRAQVLVYGLLIAKQIELLSPDDDAEESGLRESLSMRQAPATSGVVRAAPASPLPSGPLAPPPSTGRYVVAERVAPSSGRMQAVSPASHTVPDLAPPTVRPIARVATSSPPHGTPSRTAPSTPSAQTLPPEEKLSPSQSYVRRASSPTQNAVTLPPAPLPSIPSSSSLPVAPRASQAPSSSSGFPSAARSSQAPPSSSAFPAAPFSGSFEARPLADDLVGLPVKTAFEGAKLCLARGDLARAERLCRRAEAEKRDRPEVLAMLAWLEALRPENQGSDATKRRIQMLDRAISRDESAEQSYFWRGQLHKRLENHGSALRDFRKVVDLNEQHLDALREVRLYELRIRKNSISVRQTTPSAGMRRLTPGGGIPAVKK